LFAWMTTKTIAHAQWTAELMDVQPDDHILEVGFGNGANLELLAERASTGRVAGAEISKTAVEMASKRNARANAAVSADAPVVRARPASSRLAG